MSAYILNVFNVTCDLKIFLLLNHVNLKALGGLLFKGTLKSFILENNKI